MLISSIDIDSPTGDQTIPNPTWDIVEAEVRALNGSEKEGVILHSSSGSSLTICGGKNNKYVVGGYQNRKSYMCANGIVSGPSIEISVNKDFNIIESINVVDITVSLDAAKSFYFEGILSPKLKWNAVL